MDKELVAYLDERFGRIDVRFERIDERFEKIDERFSAMDNRLDRIEDSVQGARIEVESLRGDIRLVAEGVSMGFYEGLQPLRLDVASQIEDLRKTLHTSQSDLHRRLSLLEDWKRSTTTDPIALIRERFGIKPNS